MKIPKQIIESLSLQKELSLIDQSVENKIEQKIKSNTYSDT